MTATSRASTCYFYCCLGEWPLDQSCSLEQPLLNPSSQHDYGIDSTPVSSFTAPDWVLVTAQGPNSAPAPNAVIGRYAFAVYDEGGLIDINLGGFPNYASLTRPTRPTRRLAPKYPLEESEIMLALRVRPQTLRRIIQT